MKSVPPRVSVSEARCAPGDPEHGRSHKGKFRDSDAAFERAAGLFRAAGDVSRLRLLALLAEGEWCVSELSETLGEGLSTISQRLRLLRAESLVTRRREGRHIHYTLADKHVADLIRNALDHASERTDGPSTHDHDEEEP